MTSSLPFSIKPYNASLLVKILTRSCVEHVVIEDSVNLRDGVGRE